jgi:hypothetical protein
MITPEQKERFRLFALRLAAQRKEKEKLAKLALKATTTKAAPKTQIEAANAIAKELKRLHDEARWYPKRLLLSGQWQDCQCCGHIAYATTGLFEIQGHKDDRTAQRVKETTGARMRELIEQGFEIERSIEGVQLPACIVCQEPGPIDTLVEFAVHHATHFKPQLELF